MNARTTTSSKLVMILIMPVSKTGSVHPASRHTILAIQFKHMQQMAGSLVRFRSLTTSTITSRILDAFSFLHVTTAKAEGLERRERVVHHPHRVELKAQRVGRIEKRNNTRYNTLVHNHLARNSIFIFAVIPLSFLIPNVQNWRMRTRAWKDVFASCSCKQASKRGN